MKLRNLYLSKGSSLDWNEVLKNTVDIGVVEVWICETEGKVCECD